MTNLQEEWLRHAATKHNELEDHKNYWKELHLQEPTPTIQRCPTKTLKHIDHYGSLKHWIHEASNKKYWSQLIKRLTHPETPLPEQPEEWGPLSSWQARHANTINEDESNNSKDEDEHDNNQDNAESRDSLPPQQPPPRNQP